MDGIVLLIYGLEILAGILLIVILLICLRTPALIFLRAWLRGKPATLMIRKDGSGCWVLPTKVERGIAFLKRGKQELGYILSRISTTNAGPVRVGIILEEYGTYIPPQCFFLARKLWKSGWKDYTEAEVAYLIKKVLDEYAIPPEKVKADAYLEIIEGDEKKEVRLIDFLEEEIKKRGINRFIDPHDEILDSIRVGKYEKIGELEKDFSIMANFFKYAMNPAAIEDRISAERLAAREMASFGAGSRLNIQTALFFFIILVGIACFFILLTQTGTLDSLTENFGIGGSGGITVK